MPETEEIKFSVTVIDSDPNVRSHLDHFLSEAGYAVSFESDGYAALDKLRLTPTDFVITGILIPKLDGLALCRLLKGDTATEAIKVVVLSVLDTEDKALNSGADAFMKKPFELTRLLTCLHSLNGTPKRQALQLEESDA